LETTSLEGMTYFKYIKNEPSETKNSPAIKNLSAIQKKLLSEKFPAIKKKIFSQSEKLFRKNFLKLKKNSRDPSAEKILTSGKNCLSLENNSVWKKSPESGKKIS